ncbi:PD-(D/E)XK nuclease family protein [Ferrimicrobium sp.]|nr:PD-(D/E)XK nuclease family protein [Ferrimicrobium sp.]
MPVLAVLARYNAWRGRANSEAYTRVGKMNSTLAYVNDVASTVKRPGTVALVAEDDDRAASTHTLINRSSATLSRSRQLDQWLKTRTDIRATRREQVKATLIELDRFDIAASTLAEAGYHGRNMASLLSDYRDHYPDNTQTPDEQRWTHARLGFGLLSSAEIDGLALGATDHALVTIADWRSPELDPTSARMIEGLTRHGFRLQGHPDDHLKPAVATQVYRFTDPDQEVAWTFAEILARLHTGEIGMNDAIIYVPNSRHYYRALGHYSLAYRLPIVVHRQRQAARTILGHHILELLDLLQLGYVAGSVRQSRLLASLIADQTLPDTWDGVLEWLSMLVDQMTVDPAMSAQASPIDQAVVAELFVQVQQLTPSDIAMAGIPQLLDVIRDRLGSIRLAEGSRSGGITIANTGQPIDRHRLVFVLGAVDRHLPPELPNNPLLPLAVRDRVQGLPPTAELVQWQRAQAIAMLRTATEELIITAPQRIANERTLASLLLEELELHPNSAPPAYGVLPVERTYFDSQHSKISDRLNRALSIEQARLRNLEPSTFSGMTGPINLRPLSATQLEDLGQCPFRWFVKHRLHIPSPDNATNEPDSRMLGQLVHTLLEQLPQETNPVSLVGLEEMLEDCAPTVLTRSTPNWLPIRAEIAKQLVALVSNPEFAPAPLGTQVELELHGNWYDIPVQGRIDRLDQVGPDDYTIIDYKFSKSVPLGIQDTEGRLKVDVQLSVYTQLVESNYGHVVGAKYCLVKRSKFVKAPGITKGEEPAKQAAFRLLTRLKAGDFSVAPDTDRKACTYCDFAQTCRIASRNAG